MWITSVQAQELFKVLDLVNAEFQSDPMSVQSFDLSIVKRADKIIKEIIEENKQP